MIETLQRDLGRLEGKLDSLLLTVQSDIADRKQRDALIDRRFDLHDRRIRNVENRQYYFMGGGVALGFLLSKVDLGALFALVAKAAE